MSEAFPGHLWRIYGPEYAAEPFLPPRLFQEYVVRYTEPMVRAIKKHGGFARVHCHGRIGAILDAICAMGADATDPIEPPPQGDVSLESVRREYGDRLVLFGNIELSDIESMEPPQFERLVAQTLADGTRGHGPGLCPDALLRPQRPANHGAHPEELRNDGAPGREFSRVRITHHLRVAGRNRMVRDTHRYPNYRGVASNTRTSNGFSSNVCSSPAERVIGSVAESAFQGLFRAYFWAAPWGSSKALPMSMAIWPGTSFGLRRARMPLRWDQEAQP